MTRALWIILATLVAGAIIGPVLIYAAVWVVCVYAALAGVL
jgi:hypothetical protein